MPKTTIAIPSGTQYFLIASAFVVLCPLLSLPIIIYGIYQRERGAYILFALLLGIFAFISAPSSDLYRHFFKFYHLSIRPITSIIWVDISLNGIIPYIYWYMGHWGIPFGYIRFLELFIGFSLLSTIFNYLIENGDHSLSKTDIFMRFCILFGFFDFLYTTMGVKFGFALCIYLYSLHLLFHKRNSWLSFLFLLLACSWHSSFTFTAPIVYLIYKTNPKRKTLIWLTVSLAILIPLAINFVGPLLFGRRFEFYFSDKADKVASYSAMTSIGLVLYILPKLTVIPLAYLILSKYDRYSKWGRISVGWLILSIIFMTNAVAFYRFWWAFMAISVFALLDIEKKQLFSRQTIISLICFSCLFTIFNMTNYHKEILHSPYYKSIYPAPVILSQDYDRRWVTSHIGTDGELKE